MKELPYLIFIALMTIGCHHEKFKASDLPSRELIDSVISFAYKSSSITNPLLKLNSELLEWKIPMKRDNDEILKLSQSIKEFHFDFLNKRLVQQDILSLFDSEDSTFMTFQINNKYRDTLNLKSIDSISYTNCKEIELKKTVINQNTNEHFAYFQFSRPLFNKSKTICVVGLSTYDLSFENKIYEGGVLMIMKRKGNDWIFLTDIDWWGH